MEQDMLAGSWREVAAWLAGIHAKLQSSRADGERPSWMPPGSNARGTEA